MWFARAGEAPLPAARAVEGAAPGRGGVRAVRRAIRRSRRGSEARDLLGIFPIEEPYVRRICLRSALFFNREPGFRSPRCAPGSPAQSSLAPRAAVESAANVGDGVLSPPGFRLLLGRIAIVRRDVRGPRHAGARETGVATATSVPSGSTGFASAGEAGPSWLTRGVPGTSLKPACLPTVSCGSNARQLERHHQGEHGQDQHTDN